jgi:hypothetical protein
MQSALHRKASNRTVKEDAMVQVGFGMLVLVGTFGVWGEDPSLCWLAVDKPSDPLGPVVRRRLVSQAMSSL